MKPRASFQPEALQIHKHLILNLFEPLPTDPSPNPDMLSRNTRGTSGARRRILRSLEPRLQSTTEWSGFGALFRTAQTALPDVIEYLGKKTCDGVH